MPDNSHGRRIAIEGHKITIRHKISDHQDGIVPEHTVRNHTTNAL